MRPSARKVGLGTSTLPMVIVEAVEKLTTVLRCALGFRAGRSSAAAAQETPSLYLSYH